MKKEKNKCGRQPLLSEGFSVLSEQFNISFNEVLNIIDEATKEDKSLLGAINGGLSEIAFSKEMKQTDWVKSCIKIPNQDIQKGDFFIETIDNKKVSVEIKECSTASIYEKDGEYFGVVETDRSDHTTIELPDGTTVYCNYFGSNQFDILGICTYNINKKFDFYFISEKELERLHKTPKMEEKYYDLFLHPRQKISFSDSKFNTNLKEVIDNL